MLNDFCEMRGHYEHEQAMREIADNVIKGIPNYHEAVVLMHDAAGKGSTVEALPTIIEAVRNMDNTVFASIQDDTREVHHPVAR